MHIHGNPMVNAANFFSTGLQEPAAAAERAAETRRKLLKKAAEIDGGASPDSDATLLVGQWMDSRHSQVLTGDEHRDAAEGKDPDFG